MKTEQEQEQEDYLKKFEQELRDIDSGVLKVEGDCLRKLYGVHRKKCR